VSSVEVVGVSKATKCKRLRVQGTKCSGTIGCIGRE
jgi:hypothetical protein